MFAVALITGLFMYDNAEFFSTAKQNAADGMKWEYVGKQAPGDNPSIPIIDFNTGEEIIYWKMK